MKLPKNDSGYWVKTQYAKYTAARLKQKKKTELAKTVTDVNADLKAKGRAWEDEEEVRSEFMAARDSADDDLDAVAKGYRLKLASRSVTAMKEAPYTTIFYRGADYYTAAPVGENEKRYRELMERISKNLPENDEVRKDAEASLPPLIETWTLAVRDLEAAQTRAGIARTALDAASEAWLRQMEKTYGTLVQESSRAEAERYFPRQRSRTETEEA